MEPSPSDTCHNISEAKPIGHEIAHWIRLLRKQWMEPDEQPNFGLLLRISIAFVGAGTFWFSFVFVGYLELESGLRWLSYIENLLIMSLIFSAWFAGLISWKSNRYGPIRLYLSAFLLSTFVYSIIRVALLE